MKFNDIKKTYGYKANIITFLVLAVLIGINILTSFLVTKYPNLKVDISPSKIYNVSKEAREYLKTVDQNVKLMAIVQGEEKDPQIQKLHDIVARLATVNKKISFETVDVAENISFLEKYNSDNSLSEVSIIIDNGTSFRVIAPQVDYDAQQINYTDFESKIVNGINGLTSKNGKKVAILNGHNEVNLVSAKKILDEGNYALSSIDLVKDEIADDISVVVIVNPQEDFLPLEIEKLEKYAEKSGNFQMFLDPLKNLPLLNSFISKWGIETKTDLVAVEGGKENLLGKSLAKLEAVPNKYTEKLKPNEIIYSSVFYYKPLKVVNTNATVVLNTSKNAYTKLVTTEDITKAKNDKEGVFTIAAISQGIFESNKNSKMFVAGSTFFLDQPQMMARAGNLNLYSSINSDMTGGSNVINIPDKVSSAQVLTVNESQANIILTIFIIVIPIIVFIFGIVIILRRKNK